MAVKQLQDSDPMPFGKKYKGIPMEDVPASYFFWLWCNPDGPNLQHDKQSPVADYIRRNKDLLQQEYPDGIW